MKDNSNRDAVKTAEGTKVKNKAIKVLTCRQSGKLAQKVSKRRCKATDNNSGCLHLPSTPKLHPKSPVTPQMPVKKI